MGWADFRKQLIYDLLFVAIHEKNRGADEQAIADKFIEEVEDRLDVGFDAICHCLYNVADEISNSIIK